MDMKNFLRQKMREFCSENYKKFLCVEAIHNRAKIVAAAIAAK